MVETHIKMKKCRFWNMKIPMYIFDSEIAPFLKIHRRVYLKKHGWKSYLKRNVFSKYGSISRTAVSVSLIMGNSSS